MLVLVVAATLIVAAANGANDISKGISTLVGSGLSNYRRAVVWGATWTTGGALVAAVVSQKLVGFFSGAALLRDSNTAQLFLLAVATGATGWVVIASTTGLPVSTTHSLFGALIGAALVDRGGSGVLWPVVAAKIALPLLFSPLISLLLVIAILPLVSRVFRRANQYCVCIEERPASLALPEGGTFERVMPMGIVAGRECSTAVARFNAVDSAHWISSGATSFFRGMNDAPKILALGTGAAVALSMAPLTLYLMVSAAMLIGALIGGFRVTRTLAKKVTPISTENGFAANLITSALVGLASFFSLPVSTTHVSTGAIVGIGVSRGGRKVHWRRVGGILAAWVVTLPVSAAIAAVTLWISGGL